MYLRGLGYESHIVNSNELNIKNLSIVLEKTKHFVYYDSSLTPNRPTSFDVRGFFYPLINGRMKSESKMLLLLKN